MVSGPVGPAVEPHNAQEPSCQWPSGRKQILSYADLKLIFSKMENWSTFND